MMHRLNNWLRSLGAVVLLLLATHANAVAPGTCFGRMANPITDICWSCMLPITIGAANLTPTPKQDDRPNPGSPICICPTSMFPWVKIGLEIGFWEPARMVEVVRTPNCFPGLGGVSIGMTSTAPEAGQDSRTVIGGGANASFYQAHVYVNPLLYILGLLSGLDCLEDGAFDVAYVTELDPMWNSDETTLLLNPEAVLFASLPAAMTCVADCVASMVGMPIDLMMWCAGCNGIMYPANGHVQEHIGGIEASSLIVTRMLFKMHREFLARQYWGEEAVCGPKVAPLMTKSAYKKSLVYPLNQTTIAGQCCSPLGRSSVLWGAGMEFPVRGEDYVYQIFRKRNCCASYAQK